MAMTNYKQYLQSQIGKMKTSASQLISPKEEDNACTVNLDPHVYEQLQQAAAARRTTVHAVINQVLQQHLSHKSNEPPGAITQEQIENNPLLLLDGFCSHE